MGERIFSSYNGVASVLSARDDHGPSPETGISFQGELDGERRPARTSSEGAAAQRCGALL